MQVSNDVEMYTKYFLVGIYMYFKKIKQTHAINCVDSVNVVKIAVKACL